MKERRDQILVLTQNRFIIPELDKRNSQRIERSIAQVLKQGIYITITMETLKKTKKPSILTYSHPKILARLPQRGGLEALEEAYQFRKVPLVIVMSCLPTQLRTTHLFWNQLIYSSLPQVSTQMSPYQRDLPSYPIPHKIALPHPTSIPLSCFIFLRSTKHYLTCYVLLFIICLPQVLKKIL